MMNQYEINQKLISEALDLFYKQSKPTDAIEKIDLVLQTEKNSYNYFLKATVLKETNKHLDALKVIDDGLGHDLKSHLLLKMKAEILAHNFLHLPSQEASAYVVNALDCIKKAQLYFEESSKVLREVMKGMPDYSEYQIDYSVTKSELRILESDIKNLHNSLFVLSRAENIEKQLLGERVRIIELLGVFTAILAFIFSSVQIVTKLAVPEALILVTGTALLLISFLLVLHMVLDPTARTKHIIAILVIIVLVLVGLPWYVKKLEVKEHSASTQVNLPTQERIKEVK